LRRETGLFDFIVSIKIPRGLSQLSRFRILFDSPEFVAVDKPYGIHVHPPEDGRFRVSKATNGLAILRDQLGKYVYPVHRIDRSTSGVVLYALTSDAASKLAGLFAKREVTKIYFALVRGEARGEATIDSPLAEEGKSEVDARTRFQRISTREFPWANDRFETSRYSLLRVNPETGRYHQIRRHLRRENHPIIGDTVHGDGVHNRHWRAEIGRPYLFLKAYSLAFRSPFDGRDVKIASYWNSEWLRVFEQMGICPRESIRPVREGLSERGGALA
jgi:tRNA pseudouridine65 synthase